MGSNPSYTSLERAHKPFNHRWGLRIKENGNLIRLKTEDINIHSHCMHTGSLLWEPASLPVAVSSRNRQDLIQSIVPTHYVYNKFI